MMQMNQVQQSIDRIEQCADEAVSALRSGGGAPEQLRQCVDEMHRGARDARDMARQQSADEGAVRSKVDSLEELGDRTMEVCRNAGSSVDPQLQSAIKRTHDEISGLKKQIH